MGLLPIFGVPSRSGQTTILSNGSTGVDISTLFSAAVWTSSIKKRVIIPSGVTRGSTVRTTPAIKTGTGRGGVLDIIIDGTIEGCGAPETTTFVDGLDGGDCFLAEQSGVNVLGSGLIRSGGGAGGKGGNGTSSFIESQPETGFIIVGNTSVGGIYWAIRGGYHSILWDGYKEFPYDPGIFTSGGWTYERGSYAGRPHDWDLYTVRRYRTITVSQVGGNSGRGRGHDGANTNGVAGGENAGTGGNGGDWGTSGADGAAGNAGAGTAAGLAGFALRNTSNITNLFTGTLQGRTG